MTLLEKARRLRKRLVHAAGCVYWYDTPTGQGVCPEVAAVSDWRDDYLAACREAKIRARVPRSLRHGERALYCEVLR